MLKRIVSLLFITSLLFIFSCSQKVHKSSSLGFASGPINQFGKMEYAETSGYDHSFHNLIDKERKILYSAHLTLTVAIPDSTSKQLALIAGQNGGYVSETSTYSTTIRVKSENFKKALEDIYQLGRLDRKNIQGQDVTEDYLDYKIRLENAVQARKRYLELLAKAENVEAALLVEKELERLNGTIDQLKGKLNRLDHLEEYSTITISLNEKKKPGLLGYIGLGVYHGVKWLFIRN